MKKIIKGKLYDTETATELCSWWNEVSYNDFNHVSETLYKKRTGEYFIYGEGGAMSKYAKSCGSNCWSGGETIMPITEANARDWAEEHIDVDEYFRIFGEVAE